MAIAWATRQSRRSRSPTRCSSTSAPRPATATRCTSTTRSRPTTMFGERIAHGMLTGGFFSTMVGMVLPGPGSIYLGQTMQFRAPVKPGDEVRVRVEVTEYDPERRRAHHRHPRVGGRQARRRRARRASSPPSEGARRQRGGGAAPTLRPAARGAHAPHRGRPARAAGSAPATSCWCGCRRAPEWLCTHARAVPARRGRAAVRRAGHRRRAGRARREPRTRACAARAGRHPARRRPGAGAELDAGRARLPDLHVRHRGPAEGGRPPAPVPRGEPAAAGAVDGRARRATASGARPRRAGRSRCATSGSRPSCTTARRCCTRAGSIAAERLELLARAAAAGALHVAHRVPAVREGADVRRPRPRRRARGRRRGRGARRPRRSSRWREAYGITVRDGYGQTECGAVTGVLVGEEPRAGVDGPRHARRRARDRRRRAVPAAGDAADVLLGLPGRPRGHGREAARTASGTPATWSTATRDGRLWYQGRADDVISSSGYRIGPAEVESALASHPAVLEAAAVGLPDADRGEIVHADVVLQPGRVPTTQLRRRAAAARAPR